MIESIINRLISDKSDMRETDKTRQDRPNVRLVFAIGQCSLVWSNSRMEPKRGYK